MNESFEFVGRKYDDEEKVKIENTLREWAEDGTKKLEGELEKTQEDLKNISVVNSLLENEFKSLNISGYGQITPEKVHILPDDVFKKHFPNFDGVAQFQSLNDAIYVNKDKVNDRPLLISRILHEVIHRASNKKYYADNDGGISDARLGYRIRSPWKELGRQDRMTGFNEIINDYTVYKILSEDNNELLKSIGIGFRDTRGPIYNYMKYLPVLETIAKSILKHKNITEEFAGAELFKKWERGQFEGSMLVLKEIEESCGKGSLDILSYLGELDNPIVCEEVDADILSYFNEDDLDKKEIIATKIKEKFNKQRLIETEQNQD